jgi:xanthine dehydrogenase accessory factor
MSELADVVRRARAATASGQPALLATLVSVRGSSYRRPGARVLIACDEVQAGSVSGGCLERDLVRRGWWRTDAGAPVLVTYDSAEDDDLGHGIGLGCDGVVDLLLERLAPGWEATSALGFAARCLEAEQIGALATVFRSRLAEAPAGTWVGLLDDAAPVGPAAGLTELVAAARGALGMVSLCDGAVEALVETVHPPPHLFLMAAGADAVPLVDLARALGWRTTVWDAAARFETRRRFAHADRRVTGPAAVLRADVDRAFCAVAVVMGHDLRRDGEALAMLLPSRARYVGVLGPRRRTDRLLAELGVTAAPPSLHAPAGLSLGAETPPEIALSIAAEIQAVLAAETVGHLRDRRGPIHQPAQAVVCAVTCAILAAGASRRFGGPKQLAEIDGAPMLRRIAAQACRSSCARVAVVLGARADTIGPTLDGLPIERVDNPGWSEGMASSIRAAVAWARARGAGALLLAVGDQPALDAAHLDALIAASQGGQQLAASRYAGVLGPPAVFPASAFAQLETLTGDLGARALLRAADARVAAVDWPEGAHDVDGQSATVSGYTTGR